MTVVAAAAPHEAGFEQRREQARRHGEHRQRPRIGAPPIAGQHPPGHQPDENAGQHVLLRIGAARQHDMEHRQAADHVVGVVQPLPALRPHAPDRGIERGRAEHDQADGRKRRHDQRRRVTVSGAMTAKFQDRRPK